MSASDIQTYLGCPLRYKFARVLRIPAPQTVQQRFGIVIHQVLERYHSDSDQTLEAMLELLEQVWRRSAPRRNRVRPGFMAKARDALCRYHARLAEESVGPGLVRALVLVPCGPPPPARAGGSRRPARRRRRHRYELIDYKTSRPRTPEELSEDVQLSLYALAAREDWQLESSRQAYYYVLDDLKVPVPDVPGTLRRSRSSCSRSAPGSSPSASSRPPRPGLRVLRLPRRVPGRRA